MLEEEEKKPNHAALASRVLYLNMGTECTLGPSKRHHVDRGVRDPEWSDATCVDNQLDTPGWITSTVERQEACDL